MEIYRDIQKVTTQGVSFIDERSDSKNGGREYIFRQSVHSIIEALPYDKLSELFNFIITDPNSDESKSKFMNPNTPMHIIEKLKYLEINDLIEFETTIKI